MPEQQKAVLSNEEFEQILKDVEEKHKDLLPNLFVDIWDTCNREVSLLIWRYYAGKTLYIPVCKPEAIERHNLCELLGKESLEQLAFNWGGMTLTIPKGVFLHNFLRNKQVIRVFSREQSYRNVSRKLRQKGITLSESTVGSIVEKYSQYFQ